MNFVSQKFLEYFRAHPVLMCSNMLLSMTFPIDDVFVPFLTGKIVAAIQEKREWVLLFVMLIVVLVTMQGVYTLTTWHDALVLPSMQNFVKHQMISDIFEKFKNSQTEPSIGETMSRIIKIPLTISQLYDLFKTYMLSYLLSFFVTSAYIMSIDLTMGIVVLVLVVAVFFMIVVSPFVCMSKTSIQESSLSKIDDEAEDMLRNMQTIYVSDQTQKELERIKTFEKDYEKKYLNTVSCSVGTRMVGVFIVACMMCYVAYRSRYLISKNKMTTAAFVSMFMILVNWFATLGWLLGNIKEVVINWGIIDAYEKMISQQVQKPVSIDNKTSIFPPKHGVLFYNVTHAIPTRSKPIISSLNLYVAEGERLAITGEIGCGKSTLLKLLLGLQKPTIGEIYIDGVPVSKMSRKEIRQNVVYVPQNPILFNRSIIDNIVYGVQDPGHARAIIEELGLTEAFNDHENGLDSLAGKNGCSLSGGQKQLVAVMRAMLANPKIIALDEITSSIDSKTKTKLIELCKKLFHDRTVIIVTHDPALLELATRRRIMADGVLNTDL